MTTKCLTNRNLAPFPIAFGKVFDDFFPPVKCVFIPPEQVMKNYCSGKKSEVLRAELLN